MAKRKNKDGQKPGPIKPAKKTVGKKTAPKKTTLLEQKKRLNPLTEKKKREARIKELLKIMAGSGEANISANEPYNVSLTITKKQTRKVKQLPQKLTFDL